MQKIHLVRVLYYSFQQSPSLQNNYEYLLDIVKFKMYGIT